MALGSGGGQGSGWQAMSSCSGVTTLGTGCYNTTTKTFCVGDGAACVFVGRIRRALSAAQSGAPMPAGPDQRINAALSTVHSAGEVRAVFETLWPRQGDADETSDPVRELKRFNDLMEAHK